LFDHSLSGAQLIHSIGHGVANAREPAGAAEVVTGMIAPASLSETTLIGDDVVLTDGRELVLAARRGVKIYPLVFYKAADQPWVGSSTRLSGAMAGAAGWRCS